MYSPFTLIVGMTIALLFSLGTCIVQIQRVWVNFACTKNFSISRQERLSMPAMRVCESGAQNSFWRSKKLLFLVVWSWGLHFWRESKIKSKCHWRCVLSRRVLSQQKEMQIYWWLCNNSEIHLWLWQLWSLVVCSQSSFQVTRARKNDKADQTRFFFAKKRSTWYPKNNCCSMFLFNKTNIERKNCVWTTSRLLGMCIVQIVEMKSVSTFQPIKRLYFTTVKSAKPAATFWIFRSGTKNRQLCCLAVTVHIVYTSCDYEKEKPSPFLKKNSPPIKTKHIRTWTKKRMKWVQIWNKYIHLLLADDLGDIFISQIISFNFNLQWTYTQLTQNHHDFLSLQRRNPVYSRFWTQLCYYCSKWSRPKNNNQLTRNTPSSLAIALVSKTGLFEQWSSASSNYSQPRGNNWNETRSTLQCEGSRLGH